MQMTDAPPREKALPWAQIAWFGALLAVSYLPVLTYLVWQWANDEDFSHGFFVPLVAGYIVWQRREALAAGGRRPNAWGFGLIVWGALQLAAGTLGAELFLARTAFLVSLAGAIVCLGGFGLVRKLAFPLALLLFMIPIPAIVYNQIAFPLQFLASRLAETSLSVIGIPVLREGNVLELASQRLNVVEACSGIRSLMSLGFLSLVYAYFFDAKVWMRWVLLAATVPIALAANAARITITGVLSEFDPELAKGFMHAFSGWLIFMVALAMLAGFHIVFNRIYGRFRAARPPAPPLAARRPDALPATGFMFLRRPRALVLSAALILQAAVLYGASRQENLPVAKPLAAFPAEVGAWRLAQEIPIDSETLTVLRADDTMSRYYATASGANPVSLFAAYFRSQRKGQTPHSPKNCLPGAGWQPSDSGGVAISVPGEARPIVVNRYVVSKGDLKSVVLYWYQSRNRVIASEYKAKMYLIADAIRYNRTDTALVRIVAPVAGGDEAGASAAAGEFVRAVYPILRKRLPS